MALLVTLPIILAAATHQSASDPTGLAGAPAFVIFQAGPDGLREDSTLTVDVIFSDGMLNRAVFSRGCPDNLTVRAPLPIHWMGPSARIAYVNATLTGRRGGTESADDVDLHKIRVQVETRTGGHLVMFSNDNIKKRLHGVGSWTSGLQDAYRPRAQSTPVRYLEADIAVGDLAAGGSNLELGFKVGREMVWGRTTVKPHANPLGMMHVIFNYDRPIDITKIFQATLRQVSPGNSGFFMNGIIIYAKPIQSVGQVIPTVLTHALNINAPINSTTSWTSPKFLILPPEFIEK